MSNMYYKIEPGYNKDAFTITFYDQSGDFDFYFKFTKKYITVDRQYKFLRSEWQAFENLLFVPKEAIKFGDFLGNFYNKWYTEDQYDAPEHEQIEKVVKDFFFKQEFNNILK